MVFTTGDSELHVANNGSDSNDGSSASKLTIQSAISAVPPFVRNQTTVIVGTGSYGGFYVEGLIGGAVKSAVDVGLSVVGTYVNYSPSAGASTGTVGAGSSTTNIIKPTGAANWVTNELVGKLVVVSSGSGASTVPYVPVVRPVLANTTSTITVDVIPSLAADTQFRIVVPGTTVLSGSVDKLNGSTYCASVLNCQAPISLRAVRLSGSSLDYLVYSRGNARMTIDGCVIDVNTNLNSVKSLVDSRFELTNCVVMSGSDVYVVDNSYASLKRLKLIDGSVRLERFLNGDVQMDSVSGSNNSLYATQGQYLQAEVNANSCTASPVYLEGIHYFDAVGTNKLSGGNNTGGSTYGLEMHKAGRFNIIGCSVTGAAGDILLGSDVVAWSTIATLTYGAAMRYGSTFIADSGESKAIVYGNYTYNSNVDIYGRLLLGGYFNMATSLVSVAAAGSSASDATDLSSQAISFAEVSPVGSGQGVKLPSNAAIGGHMAIVYNAGANTLTVYPPTGGAINGNSSITIASGTLKGFISLNGAGGKNYKQLF